MRQWCIVAVTLLIASIGIAIGYYLNPAGIPPVKGYAEGSEIHFIHTEASDPKVAKMLTDMMRSPVLLVPSLANVSPDLLAAVYVFKNGIRGEGPFGFQSDVFEKPPGADGYTPLRSVILVTWNTEARARELKSASDIQQARRANEITLEATGVVVNMPLLTWPGGRR